MIFRGDGKSSIYNESCFETKKFDNKKINKILLNPPYAQEDEKEIDFIDHSLNVLEPGGLFCSVFTYAVLSEKNSAKWRKNLLLNHSIEAVISLPTDLFYPTSANTVIMVARAKVPHKGKIFFCKINNDGFRIYRKKRIEIKGSELSQALKLFKIKDIDPNKCSINGFSNYVELDKEDDLCELVPEAYLEDKKYTNEEINDYVERLLLEFGSFKIKNFKELSKIKKNKK